MRRFLRMLLAVLFCTTAMCTYDCFANVSTSNTQNTKVQNTIQNSIQNEKSTTNNSGKNAYSDEEVYLAAQLIYHEAHNQSFNGKAAIAEIVLNRLNSSLFPDTVEGVIFQNGQFTSARSLRNIEPTDQELRIARSVLSGRLKVLNDDDVLYFRNPTITSGISAKLDKNWGKLDYYTHIGDHAFYAQDINMTHEEVAATEIAKKATEDATAQKKATILEKIPTALHNIANFFTPKKNKLAKVEETTVEEATEENVVNDEDTSSVEESSESAIAVENLFAVQNELPIDGTEEASGEMSLEDALILQNAMLLNDTMGIEALNADDGVDLDVTDEDADAIEEDKEEADDADSDAGSDSDSDGEDLEDKESEDDDAKDEESEVSEPEEVILLQKDEEEPELSEAEKELAKLDKDDPVAIARRQAILNEKAEVEVRAKIEADSIKARERAEAQARGFEQAIIDKAALDRAEYMRATQAAVTLANSR